MYFRILRRWYSSSLSKPSSVQYISINNPSKRNALSKQVLENLKQSFLQVKQNDQIKVVILKSDGPVFSSGHDLKELTLPEFCKNQNYFNHTTKNIHINQIRNNNKQFHEEVFGLCSEVMEIIQELETPVIAQVQGLATAAGCQLVATCDLAICSPHSSFATPGVTIGLFCSTPAVALVRTMTSSKKLMEMLLTGKSITAQEALQYGIVNKISSSHEKLEEETLEMAIQIAQYSGQVLKLGKKVFREQVQMNRLHDAYVHTTQTMVSNLQIQDCKEGIEAFLQKRKPKWK